MDDRLTYTDPLVSMSSRGGGEEGRVCLSWRHSVRSSNQQRQGGWMAACRRLDAAPAVLSRRGASAVLMAQVTLAMTMMTD